jgi:hypothetical protein
LRLEKGFERFERAAAKGHEESIWITGVAKGAKMEKNALKEAFAKTEEPLGWHFAGKLSKWKSREGFDFYKKSAEGGCSWGQVAYAFFFKVGHFVEKDEKVFLEWLEKAANQNNPCAMFWLGFYYRNEGDDQQKAVSHFRAAAELGWKIAMDRLAESFLTGWGCVQDLRQAMICGAKAIDNTYYELRDMVKKHLLSFALEEPVLNEYCFWLGWGLYWYAEYDVSGWLDSNLLEYFIACDTEQKKALTTFLVFWNQTTGVKGPGQMIGQMVWEAKGRKRLVRFDEWIARSECEEMDVSDLELELEKESDLDDSELKSKEESESS